MFAGNHAPHVPAVQAAVVAVPQGVRVERALALVGGAGSTLQGVQGIGKSRDHLPALGAAQDAGGAGESGQHQVLRAQAVAFRGYGAPLHHGHRVGEPVLAERGEQGLEQVSRPAPVHAQAARGPVHVPAGGVGGVHKPRVLLKPTGCGERGRASPAWEGGHHVLGPASTPDLVAGSALFAVSPQPLMGDGTVHTEALQDAAHPRAGPRGTAGFDPGQVDRHFPCGQFQHVMTQGL